MTNFKVLEHKYGLLRNVAKFDEVLTLVKDFSSNSRKNEWRAKRADYYSETGDLNQAIVDILMDCQ